MIKVIKNLAVLLLVIAFLVPATGVLVFVHQCNAMGSTEYSINGSNTCCDTKSSIIMEIDQDKCVISHIGHCTHHTFLSSKPCCNDSRLFVKISFDYLTSASKIFHSAVPFLQLPDFLLSETIGYTEVDADFYASSLHPPGIDTYLFTSSMRL